ncbi:hypothetical protein SEA_GHOBES_28 [Gordonia phage Ghobes]|uniref:Uncharacterized protein n=1 Tax=Gordonia phage Ghobes TaxID=1887647 RepID=A0A1B3B033_9CAUD|nr:hypothetical protein KCH37_gp28 [Gordonia phage Ghobes]AOE44380.1 hypothetical protein SEA_GHOBES_28 [Gordonia phage Ghobes]
MALPNLRFRGLRLSHRVPPFARQKAVQTANIGDPAGNRVQVPLTSDTTYPAVVVDNTLRVTGSATVTVTLGVGGSGSIFSGVRVDLERNGVVVGSVTTSNQSNARTTTLPGVVLANADELKVWAQRVAVGSISGDVRSVVVDLVPA